MTQAFFETLATPFGASRAEWARDALGLAAEASPEDVRDAAFRAVSDDDFSVPGDVAESLDAVLGRPSRAAPHSLSSTVLLEQKVLQEIERFAKSFFGISPHKRRMRWSALNQAAAAFPNCRHRMALLEPGLDLPSQIPAESSGPLGVIRFVRELFVVAPARKLGLRRQFFRTVHPADAPLVARAARELLKKHPQTARLEPAFLERLRRLTPGARSLRRVEPDDLLWLSSSPQESAEEAVTTRPRDGGVERKPLPPFVVAIVVRLLRLIRFLMSRPKTISRAEFDAKGGHRRYPLPAAAIVFVVALLAISSVVSEDSPLYPLFHPRPVPQVAWPLPAREPLSRDAELLPGERCRTGARLLKHYAAAERPVKDELRKQLTGAERAAAVRTLAFLREMSDSHQEALRDGIAVAELPPPAVSAGDFVIPLLYPGERAELERAIQDLQSDGGH